MSDLIAGLHAVLTLATLVGVGVLVYFLIKDRRKIEAAYQQTAASLQGLQQLGQTAGCLSCQICNSTNPTIQALVTATGICGAGSCIDTSACPQTSGTSSY